MVTPAKAVRGDKGRLTVELGPSKKTLELLAEQDHRHLVQELQYLIDAEEKRRKNGTSP